MATQFTDGFDIISNLHNLEYVLETVADRDYHVNDTTPHFLHMKLANPSLVSSPTFSIKVENYNNGSNGLYSAFIPTMSCNLSFRHEITHKETTDHHIVIKFFVQNIDTGERLACSGQDSSSTDAENDGNHTHLFHVMENTHYAIGVILTEDSPHDHIIKIMQGSKLILKPIINQNSRLTGAVTTSFGGSYPMNVGQFFLHEHWYDTIILRMWEEGIYINQTVTSVPPYNNVTLYVSNIIASGLSFNETYLEVKVQMITSIGTLDLAQRIFHINVPDDRIIETGDFTLDLYNNYSGSAISPQFLVSIIIHNNTTLDEDNNPESSYRLEKNVIGDFVSAPNISTAGIITSGAHVSLSSGKKVDKPTGQFFYDFRGVTKFDHHIQFIKYKSIENDLGIGNGVDGFYSSFVSNKNITVEFTYIFEVTSNETKQVNFFVTRNYFLSDPQPIEESKLEINMVEGNKTKRYEKKFTLEMVKGKEYFILCSDGGDFTLGPTSMLHVEEINNGNG